MEYKRSYEQLQEVYGVQLRLAQYPILAPEIRKLMRRELFARGIITQRAFESEVTQKAVVSQHREGLGDPFGEEPAAIWNARLAIIRDQLTDFYFANNYPTDRLDQVIQRTLSASPSLEEYPVTLRFNPELAPIDLLFDQGEAYEALPAEQLARVRHHLREIIVVLIKSMLSDQLEFIGIAKEVFTVRDLRDVRQRVIGRGKIGGKAAGLLLAHKILETVDGQTREDAGSEDPVELHKHVVIPDSYYIGADVFYDFLMINGFTHYMNQKYRRSEEITADYPNLRKSYVEGRFPSSIVEALRELLDGLGKTPIIARSSSLLEVHFGAALAGKYESVFCPNQGTPEENLAALLRAISQVYASTLSPDALLYRQQMGLVDYDERMAVLIQTVQGTRYRNFVFPAIAGVGYSRNPFRWNPKIRRDDGFLRLVSGFGTRAVQRVARDYPRIVALSHPELRPYVGATQIRKYTQHFIDVLDLDDNKMKSLPVRQVLGFDYPGIRYLASLDKGDYISPIFARVPPTEKGGLLLTFNQLVKDRHFIKLMRAILSKLERYHQWPVDIEFTVDVTPGYPHATYDVHLLQCRPQTSRKEQQSVEIPDAIPESDLILRTTELVPHGKVSDIRYVVYVRPQDYRRAPDTTVKLEIARVIGRLNRRLDGEIFILAGPGRWGSSDVDLGVKVTYADIYNTRMLIEIAGADAGAGAEPSYGTHFFQDLVEAAIYPLPVTLGKSGTVLNAEFLDNAPNKLPELLPQDADVSGYIHVIDVPAVAQGRRLEIIMNNEQELAVGYLRSPRYNEKR
ncbi:MAG: PEP/pyruvate-binding domain-containing protein [Anaerolineae bacterium]|nr:PEP/pyruvate-binding domain-containing protein [Anaerolineae bacterium]